MSVTLICINLYYLYFVILSAYANYKDSGQARGLPLHYSLRFGLSDWRRGLPKVAGGRERRKEDGIQNAEHRTQNAELKMDRPVRLSLGTAKSGRHTLVCQRNLCIITYYIKSS
jgi:hypothetical protein